MADKPATRSAIIMATLIAGPAFVIGMAMVTFAQNAGSVQRFDPGILGLAIGLAIPVTAIGTLLAIIPCILGVDMLARLATRLEAMRLPIVWALVGGLCAFGMTLLGGPVGEFSIAMGITGGLCALAARSRLRWEAYPRIG